MNTFLVLKKATLLFILLLGVFCIHSCMEQKKEEVNHGESGSFKKKLITNEERKILVDEYLKTNNELITKSRDGEPDSRSFWLSVEDLEGYLQYVKQYAKEKQLENVGIRIYLGKYPKDYPAEKMAKPEYGGYQTIFFSPTSRSQKSSNTKSLQQNYGEVPDMDIDSIEALNMTNLAPPPKDPGFIQD